MRTFALVNRSTGRVLAPDARVAPSLWAQLVGLMGRELGGDEALGLPRCPAIHTFFVRHRLDAAFCDGTGRVLRVAANLQPFTVGSWVAGTAIVWEARAGVLAPFVTPGDVLVWEPIPPPAPRVPRPPVSGGGVR